MNDATLTANSRLPHPITYRNGKLEYVRNPPLKVLSWECIRHAFDVVFNQRKFSPPIYDGEIHDLRCSTILVSSILIVNRPIWGNIFDHTRDTTDFHVRLDEGAIWLANAVESRETRFAHTPKTQNPQQVLKPAQQSKPTGWVQKIEVTRASGFNVREAIGNGDIVRLRVDKALPFCDFLADLSGHPKSSLTAIYRRSAVYSSGNVLIDR